MIMNRVVRFLVTKDQYDKLKYLTSSKGYKTLSSYIRDTTLRRHAEQEEMIIKIYKKVVNNGK